METLRFLMVSTFYPPHHLGGDAVHVQYLSEALAAQGHEVHVEYSPAAYGVKRPLESASARDDAGRVHVHPMTRARQVSSPMAAYLLGQSGTVTRFHEKLVRDVKPDVVHLHNISLLGLGVQRGADTRPRLYTAHDYWFRCPRSDLMKRGREPCENPSCFSCMVSSHRVPPWWRATDIAPKMDKVQCVIAPSQFMKRLADASFACPAVHIPNFVPDENPSGAVGTGSSYFLYAGLLERHKGLDGLAEAASLYRGTKRFVLVGRGSEERRLRERAALSGARLELRPWADRSTLSALYREAAAFLMPSTCLENAPLAAIEALCWGVPLLTTSWGGAAELTQGGLAGYSFEPKAREIVRVLETFDALSEPSTLRRAARGAYETHHRPEVYLGRYLALVRALLSGDNPAIVDKPNGTSLLGAQAAIREA
ncbi:MAG TPA: glycosyltransferase [Thermoplasmata archaeon]|nr:glycosyltransferase [Thermoplasmata archaeon]